MFRFLLLAEIGSSDCERLADELLVQPVNALSSFAYVLVGGVVLALAWRRGSVTPTTVVFAACLAGIGLGSVAFHGPQPAGSRLLHDLPIVVTLLVMVLHDLRLLRPEFKSFWPSLAVGTAVATVVSWLAADAAGVLSGLLVGALVVSEAMIFRRRLRPASARDQLRAYGVTAGVLVMAGALWLLGRTDSPVCDPDSFVQPHGLWHITSALVFGMWWWIALRSSPGGSDPTPSDDGVGPHHYSSAS